MPMINHFDSGSAKAKEWLGQFGPDHRVGTIFDETMISDQYEGLAREERSVNVGIIGAGAIAQRGHIPEFSSIAGVRVCALADLDQAKAKSVAEKAKIPHFFTDYREMLALEELDAIAICAPNSLHAEMTKASCEAGKHVLCEKPMATSVQDAKSMVDAAEGNGVVLMIEHLRRFIPHNEVLKEMLSSGLAGDIISIRTTLGHSGADSWSPMGSWFFDKALSGGGVLIDLGIHAADLLNWFSEGMEVVEVIGKTSSITKKWSVEDYAVGTLVFSSGAIASMEVSWCTKPSVGSTVVVGTEGTILANCPGLPQLIFRSAGSHKGDFIPDVPRESKYGSSFRHFIDCTRTEKTPLTAGEVGLQALEVVAALYESDRIKAATTLGGD